MRDMVRTAIANQTGRGPGPAARCIMRTRATHSCLSRAAETHTGACIIEPSVRCTHCGYCCASFDILDRRAAFGPHTSFWR